MGSERHEPGYYWIRVRYGDGSIGEPEVAKYDPNKWGSQADWWTVGQEIPDKETDVEVLSPRIELPVKSHGK